jgi:hypothetical protein
MPSMTCSLRFKDSGKRPEQTSLKRKATQSVVGTSPRLLAE